jgi:hypothetical protein
MFRSSRALAAALILLCAVLAPLEDAAPAVAARAIPGFEVFCFYSHSAKDDPIVDPGMPGQAMHQHDFEGNTSANADSTPAQLRASSTNCALKADTAAYWTPTLYSHGHAVHPDRLHSYYRWGNVSDVAHIQPMPANLKMIAGNPMAMSRQSTSVIGWNCGVQGQTLYNHPISCRTGQKVVLHVFFPNCWDGVHLDSPDHRSHMAYSHLGKCPSDHPVSVPRLSEDFGYPITDGTGITLASGSYVTAHADFWNTWRQSTMIQLTHDCINRGRQCGPQHG